MFLWFLYALVTERMMGMNVCVAVWFLKRRSEAGGSLELNSKMGHEVLWELT